MRGAVRSVASVQKKKIVSSNQSVNHAQRKKKKALSVKVKVKKAKVLSPMPCSEAWTLGAETLTWVIAL